MRAAVRETMPRISSISSSAKRLCRLGMSATASSTSSGFRLDRHAISNSSRRYSTVSPSSSRWNASDIKALHTGSISYRLQPTLTPAVTYSRSSVTEAWLATGSLVPLKRCTYEYVFWNTLQQQSPQTDSD
ncbi:unnamed protein product [Phytophthora lilii]|uniref:Unnamed protein product n=1 Tax=Phytophthora lilii TaxID=2077276 RepID=A0A9W6TE09_9STRA|nr:unnamed protein product [Phytophthora lilii]